MFVSGLAVQGVFFGTAALFPICAAPPTAGDLGLALLALACWRDACFSLPYLRRWPQRI